MLGSGVMSSSATGQAGRGQRLTDIARVAESLQLHLNPKSTLYPWPRGVDFCGYRIWPTHILPRKRNMRRLRQRLRRAAHDYAGGRCTLGEVREVVMSARLLPALLGPYRPAHHALGDPLMTLSAIVGNRLMVDGAPAADLPRLPIDTRVHVWSAPDEYRADGLFIAVQRPGDPEEVPACDPRACQRLGTLDYPADPDAVLDALKGELCAQINAERDRRLAGGVEYSGHRFDTDPKSVQRISGAVQLVALDPAYATDWITTDNAIVHLDAAALIGLGQAIGAHEAACIFAARQAKDAVLAASGAGSARLIMSSYFNQEAA